jgi:peroxiredoxin (alkyl hydroperoxide reductase subunit C)
MTEERAAGCTRPAASTVAEETRTAGTEQSTAIEKERKMVNVGEKAPDFVAPGYQNGQFLEGVRLSDYAGKWLLLCFYPGDFTFV